MSQEPFGDIPLFRELQRLLTSDSGPVNLEIARQVAGAIAANEGAETQPDAAMKLSYAEKVLTAQRYLAGYTGLPVAEPPGSDVITRESWIEATLKGWGWLTREFAGRLGNVAEGGPEEGAGPGSAQAVIGQILPLMMGLQVGTLVGHLATEALFRYELPIPRDDDGKLFLVAGNLDKVVEGYGFERDDFLAWIALRDTAKHLLIASHPWIENYFRSALSEVVGSIEIDMQDIERRMVELQSGGFEGLEGMSAEDALPLVQTPRHQAAVDRLRALVSVFEGYASHSAGEVSSKMIETYTRIDEGMARYYASPSEGKQALAAVLGVSSDREVVTQGATFCAAVVKLRGMASLNSVWAAPDNLPSLAEIKDPFAWMERVLDN